MSDIVIAISCIFYTLIVIGVGYFAFKIGLNMGLSSVRKNGETAQFHPLQRVAGKAKVNIGRPDPARAVANKKAKVNELPEGIMRKGAR